MKIAPASLLRFIFAFVFGGLGLASRAQPNPMPYPACPEAEADANSHLPKLLSHVDPLYPAALVESRIQGDVHVAFIVDSAGTPVKVRAFFGRDPELEKSAEDAVRQWKFSPGIHLGRVVSTQMVVAIHFAPPPPAAAP